MVERMRVSFRLRLAAAYPTGEIAGSSSSLGISIAAVKLSRLKVAANHTVPSPR